MSEQNEEVAIAVRNVHKSFRLPHEQASGIKQLLVNKLKGKKGYEIQHVLNGISFEIKKGEFFGIVGRNGSGKSTLLKLLAEIYVPNGGDIEIKGSLTPFIELGVGFNPELTGRENVYMNGALLGMSTKEVESIYDEIVEFAEIEKFMDQKLKNYSSGMQVRLAFSIAIRAKSDILLFDEVLAVGDASFQQKCYEMFNTLKEEGRTIVLVTHDMSAVQRFCERALLIDKGDITLIGNPSDIADRYLEQNYEKKQKKSKNETQETTNFLINDVTLSSGDKPTNSFNLDEEIKVQFKVQSEDTAQPIRLGFQIFSNDGTYVFGTNSKNALMNSTNSKIIDVSVSLRQHLAPGTYHVTLAVMNKNATKVLRYLPKIATFNIKQQTEIQGLVIIENEWDIRSQGV